MVRLGALATALALLFGGGAAAGPGVYAGAEQMADASWIVGKGLHPDFYFAIGIRMLDEAGLVTVGAVGKGECNVQKEESFTTIMCSGMGRAKEIPAEDFQLDPLLESGSLRVQVSGFRHTVSWTGRGRAPAASGGVQSSGDYADAWAGVFRDAKAKGRVFGKKVSSGPRDLMGFLAHGAGAGVYNDYRETTFLDGGRVRYEVTFRR